MQLLSTPDEGSQIHHVCKIVWISDSETSSACLLHICTDIFYKSSILALIKGLKIWLVHNWSHSTWNWTSVTLYYQLSYLTTIRWPLYRSNCMNIIVSYYTQISFQNDRLRILVTTPCYLLLIYYTLQMAFHSSGLSKSVCQSKKCFEIDKIKNWQWNWKFIELKTSIKIDSN